MERSDTIRKLFCGELTEGMPEMLFEQVRQADEFARLSNAAFTPMVYAEDRSTPIKSKVDVVFVE